MIDVLVTCFPHGDSVSLFPQVRGYYLARHLARAGLRAEFRQLPLPGFACKVLISSEYQYDMPLFERKLIGPFSEIQADRWFCLVDEPLHGRPDHFSYDVCQWFASRGGVLCHMASGELEPYEHWIGLGVDFEVVRPAADGRRDHVLFDFPRSNVMDGAAGFDVNALDLLRRELPGYQLVGSGPADAAVRPAFELMARVRTASRQLRPLCIRSSPCGDTGMFEVDGHGACRGAGRRSLHRRVPLSSARPDPRARSDRRLRRGRRHVARPSAYDRQSPRPGPDL